jgi:hypothetical protein
MDCHPSGDAALSALALETASLQQMRNTPGGVLRVKGGFPA